MYLREFGLAERKQLDRLMLIGVISDLGPLWDACFAFLAGISMHMVLRLLFF